MRFTRIMTSEQASILYGIVEERRAPIVEKWSVGIWDGLLYTLMEIDRGGGARLLGHHLPVIDYGNDLIEAAIIPPSAYIAWTGRPLVRPYLEPTPLPEASMSVYRALSPLVIAPLAAAVLPDPPCRCR